MLGAVVGSTTQFRDELDRLEQELEQFSAPGLPGFEPWRHKMNAMIGEIAGPRSALAIQFSGIRWTSSPARARLDRFSAMAAPNASFQTAKQAASEVIASLQWELDRRPPETAPFSESTLDPELWEHRRGRRLGEGRARGGGVR
jgi:hypothetical protein